MLSKNNPSGRPLEPLVRDSVEGIASETEDPPTIVSLSDIHGYLDEARSALLTLRDHPEFSPIVTADDAGQLHWADENYVLVFNGDLIDRGPANKEVLELVTRLAAEAPPERVRVTLGNHEAILLSPEHFGFQDWYSCQVDSQTRRTILNRITAGEIVAAYQGYNVTYVHAGSGDAIDVREVNDSLETAAEALLTASRTGEDTLVQRRVLDDYPTVLGVGKHHLKGRGAGIVWLDFERLPTDAPPQVVGHTRHNEPARKGNVFCQNVLRNNLDQDGGEAVFIESPGALDALVRGRDGDVNLTRLDAFDSD